MTRPPHRPPAADHGGGAGREPPLREAFMAAAGAAAIVAPDGHISFATPAFGRALGIDGEPEGLSWGTVLPFPAAQDPVLFTLRDGVTRSATLAVASSARPLRLTVRAFDVAAVRWGLVCLEEPGSPAHHDDPFLDVLALAGGFAHEINSPLAAIALRAESLLEASGQPPLRDAPALDRFRRSLRAICDDLYRCKQIVAALVDYARPTQGTCEEVLLSSVVDHAVARLLPLAREREVEIATEGGCRHPVYVDVGRVRDAVAAVLRNAVEASPRGGRVQVSTASDATAARLVVRDAGPGIAPALQARVLVPFFTTKAPGDGMGLGLSVASSVVRAHRGVMLLESDTSGTRVTIELPLR